MSTPVHTARLVLIALLALCADAQHAARAQNATAVANGTAFAKSLAPTSGSQIVNPTGVNPAAWTGQTATPAAVPGQLGKFSTPNVSNTPLTAAKAMGLAGYGNQAVDVCAGYDPNSGDPIQTQTCAAVNFLANKCLSPTTAQGNIMTANGTSQVAAADCAGTYGNAQAHYGYAEQISSNDAIFTVVTGLPTAAPGATQQGCAVQTVVVTPAQYDNVTCSKDNFATAYTCTQTMTARVVVSDLPPLSAPTCDDGAQVKTGTFANGYSGPYCEYDFGPFAGGTRDHACVDLIDFDDQVFINFRSSSSCGPRGCQTTLACYYQAKVTCPVGFTLTGATCTKRGLERTFSDNCGAFTTSAGAPLPQP